jgi:hypothetical protein
MKHPDMKMLDHGKRNYFVRLEVLTTATMKSIVLLDVTPCILVGADWRYGGRYWRNLKVKE